MKNIKLLVKTKTQKYPIIIGSNLIYNITAIAQKNSLKFKQCLLIIDKKVPKKIVLKIKRSLSKKKRFFIFLVPVRKIKILI